MMKKISKKRQRNILKNKVVYFVLLLLLLPLLVFIPKQQQNKNSYAAIPSLAVDVQVGTNQTSASTQIISPKFSLKGNELVVVFLTSDGPSSGSQTFSSVTGGGLIFALAKRANGQKGTAEAWYAYTATPVSNIVITAKRGLGSYHGMMQVASFTGATNTLGAVAGAGGPSGAPSVGVTTTMANSWVWGVGNDWDNAVARTPGVNQSLVRQFIDTKIGDTYWTQEQNTITPTAGTFVSINDTAPTTDQWNLVAVEITSLQAATTSLPTSTPTPLTGVTSTPIPTPITSSFPSSTNTGYKNAPGYPGQLTEFTGTIQSNTTYKFMDFSNGLYLGDANNHPTNVTFYGCRFASNAVLDANVADYGDNITFDYSTFAPSTLSAPPVAHSAGYQYGIDQRYNGQVTINHSDFWGWANGIQLGYSSQSKPFMISNSWFHDARDDGGVDHTDAILENYGGQSYITVNHNTIVSKGNTNGLGLQGNNYHNISVTNNYFSGFGYTVNIGGSGAGSTNLTFVGNTFGTDIKPIFGPLYGWLGSSSANDLWRQNNWHVVSGSYYTNFADDGKYWWPDGTLSTFDYSGF